MTAALHGPHVEPRRPEDPIPDLLDYRVVHRAMTVDLDRLAVVAGELVERPDRSRWAALRRYLGGVADEVESHHQVEDDHVWPMVAAVSGQHPELLRLTADHDRLSVLLHRARTLTDVAGPTPGLHATLREIAEALAEHVRDEEREVFPLIEQHVREEDYQRLQQHFRGNLRVRQLPFVVPWIVGHATPDERPALLATAGWPMRLVLALSERRFRTRRRLLFSTVAR